VTRATTPTRTRSVDIPFNRPHLTGLELDYMGAAMSGGHTSSSGGFSRRVAALLREQSGASEVLLTTSCTAALELSGLLLDLQPGDTVVVPSFTFSATALAFARGGARLLFCDIEPTTLGLDPRHLAELLDDSVRAVVPVHYAGVSCDVAGIRRALADRPDVRVIEDNAHGFLGSWHGQPLGSLGHMSTLSFHETKNFSCGEGGALLVNDPAYVDRARVLYDKGTNRRAFMLGRVDKYSWKDTGSSFGLADVLAAYLSAQLERREQIQAERRRVFDRYRTQLEPHAAELGLTLPHVPSDVGPAYHMFYVLMRDGAARNRALEDLAERGVQATFHYVPLHSSDGGLRFSARRTACPVTDDVSARLLRLPFYADLGDDDVDRVVTCLLDSASAGREPGRTAR
jgi:dTDP-4-amino-4,6-dideoxygalactose transaminase